MQSIIPKYFRTVINIKKPIRGAIFNFNKLVSDLDIETCTPYSSACKLNSKYVHPAAGHVIKGNLKIISDSRIRSIIAKGPKYRFPVQTDFQTCREKIAGSLNEFCSRWCKREHVECDALKDWKLNIFTIIDRRVSFYSQNTNMLPRTPKISYRYLKSGIEEFHTIRKYVLVPADKATNNVDIVWRLYYIDTLKQELGGTKAYEQTSDREKSVINNHIFHNATRFVVSVNEDQERLPTFNWLPKLHK